MKQIKHFLLLFSIALFVYGCGSYATQNTSTAKEDPVVIANKSLEYEIIIIDPGFTTYLNTVARPMNFYSKDFLATKNRFYVAAWNSRVRNPSRYNSSIYENEIEYEPTIDYGLEVNYKLFSYFKFAEQKYKMKLK